MPYIKCEERTQIDRILGCLDSFDEGQLNYIITQLCRRYIGDYGESYRNYNTLVGVLECAKLELYRRKISNYENVKIEINGDVY